MNIIISRNKGTVRKLIGLTLIALFLLTILPQGEKEVHAEPTYVMATASDFVKTSKSFTSSTGYKGGSSYWEYVGNEEWVEIPDDLMIDGEPVTKLLGMFRENPQLKGVKVNRSNTNVTSFTHMFANNESPSLDLSQLDTSNITSMHSMFYSSEVMSLDLSNWDTSSVEIMDEMFYDAKLNSLDLTHFNTSNVISMNSMFAYSELNSLDLSNWDTSSVIIMSFMFTDAELNSLDISNWDTSSVKNMTRMFAGGELTQLDLSSFDTSNVTSIMSMFNSSKIEELDLSSFDMSKVSLKMSAFAGSKATKGYARTQNDADILNVGTGKPSNLIFKVKDEDGYILATDADFSGNDNGQFMYIGNEDYVEIPHIIKGVDVTSYEYMFADSYVKGVKSTNKNVTNLNYMFIDNRANKLDLTNLDTTNVKNMRSMFSDSRSTELDLSGFDTSNVENMGSMFAGSSIKNVDLNSFDTSKVNSMNSMFNESEITEFDLSSFDLSNVENVSFMFRLSNAMKGYARTQVDADILNASNSKPSNLNFIVKGKPIIYIENNGDSNFAQSHSTEVNIDWAGASKNELKYQWTASNSFPTSGTWISFNSGETLTNDKGTDNYYLHVMAKSNLNRTEKVTSNLFKFDNKKPTKPIINVPSSWKNSNIIATITDGTDAHSGVDYTEYRLNNGTWQTYGGSLTISDNGETTIEARTFDNAGNLGDIASQTVKIDKIAPSIIITPSTTGITHEDVILTVNATDGESGVKRIRQSGSSNWYESDEVEFTIKENGTYKFYAADNAGNLVEKSITINNIDKTMSFNNPTITAFYDVTLKNNNTVQTNVSDITIADWRDNAGFRLNVSAIQFSLVGDSFALPKGTIRLAPLQSITKIDGNNNMPTKGYTSTQAIDDGFINLINGVNSRGEYVLAFPNDALEIVFDGSVAKRGMYESTITWELVSAP